MAEKISIGNTMYIKVKVMPSSRDESFIKLKENTYRIKVREKAERNMANNRVRTLLAQSLNISENKIHLISGHHSLSKIFSVS